MRELITLIQFFYLHLCQYKNQAAMLLRLKIRNFTSFYEEVTFDMFPNLKRTTFQNHVYSDYDIPLLKQAAIYGANGSGKSNFIDAIGLIRNIVISSETLKKYPINFNKFRLKSYVNDEPIVFTVEFEHEKSYFIYTIEIDSDKIRKEELLLSGLGKKDNETIFSRVGDILTSVYSNTNVEIQEAANKFLKDNPLVSLFVLSENFPFFKDDKLIKIAKNWFVSQVKILSLRRIVPDLIELLSSNEELLKYSNKIFHAIGIGIKAIEVEEGKLNEIVSEENDEYKEFRKELIHKLNKNEILSNFDNEKIVMSFSKNKEDELVVKRLLFKHVGMNDFERNLEIQTQSDGTARILNLIPVFFELEKKPVAIFIDEIENSIHPLLMMKLIKYFSESDTKGQLIYTTHETELLNQQELIRPDEIWFAEKHNGQTALYSLNDFKEHNTLNIRNGYLDGRYGAIPFTGDINE